MLSCVVPFSPSDFTRLSAIIRAGCDRATPSLRRRKESAKMRHSIYFKVGTDFRCGSWLCKNAASLNSGSIDVSLNRTQLFDGFVRCSNSPDLRKNILGVSQFAEFRHSQGHQEKNTRRANRVRITPVTRLFFACARYFANGP
jgi:hypothetical protein